jgi:hypothetical protein
VNGLTGTLVSAPAWVAGRNGTGLSFNGTSTYVDLGNPTALQFTGSMTLSAWVFETANVGDDGQIIAKSDGGSGWQLKSTPDTGVRTFAVAITDANGSPVQRYSRTVRALNTWYHVAGVFNAATRTLDIYVNGVLDNGVLDGTVPTGIRSSPVNVNIGRRTGGFNIRGTLDDVRIYARALAATEIQADMGSPVGNGSGTGDTTPPTVAVTAPANGATVLGTAVSVTATATDNLAVAGVQFLLDGANLGAEDTAAPYAVTWDTTTATSGTHVLTARARDTSGNTQTSAPVTVNVDNQATTGSVVINGGAAATNSTAATLTLSATDAQGAVAQMRFSNTGTSYSTAEAYATSKAWTLTTGAGVKTVYVQFRDAAGNWSAAFTDTIVLDTTAPTISAVTATGISASAATITWTTNEAATSRVEYGLTTSYGSSTPLDSTLVTSHSVSLSGLGANTTYQYRVRSIDAAGNERIGSNASFRTAAGADTTPPSIPTGLGGIAVSPAQVMLPGTPRPDNVGVTGYIVFGTGRRSALRRRPPSRTPACPGRRATRTPCPHATRGTLSAIHGGERYHPGLRHQWHLGQPDHVQRATIRWTTDQLTTSQVSTADDVPTERRPRWMRRWSYEPLGQPHRAGAEQHLPLPRHLPGRGREFHHLRRQPVHHATGGDGWHLQNEILLTGLNLPTAIKFLPNGDMLALELGGRIRRVHTDTWTVDPLDFLTLTNIGTLNGQQGLMDLTFDPNFASNHYYYVFSRSGPQPRPAQPVHRERRPHGPVGGSEFVLYQDPQVASAEHHGGALSFGNDGKLYVTTGEHFGRLRGAGSLQPRERSSASTPMGPCPPTTPSTTGRGRTTTRSGRSAYAIPTGRPTTRPRAGCTSGTSAATTTRPLRRS